jgi:transposase InsO family protein
MDQRMKFVVCFLEHEWPMAALCREFGVSRKTGYKIVSRYIEEGLDGLKDRSRARHHHPNMIADAVERVLVKTRSSHPNWGPRKIRTWLIRRNGQVRWPAASTIGEVLTRHGLTVRRQRSRKTQVYDQPFVGCNSPNAVWSADFKGWFMTGDKQRCDPLTITDNYSRYLFRCQAVRATGFDGVKPVFEAVFREYGLPMAIRTDNGPPFATTTVGSLSRLSIWWLKLGIIPERIEPGKPSQNGRHERMHRTLKQDTANPPKRTWRIQQRAFDHFRDEYNQERPHEAINMLVPADLYIPSRQPYPLLLPEMTYPDDMIIRSVKSQGDLSWKSRHIYLSETLSGELVGLRQIDDRLWDIYFGPIRLAQLDTYEKRLIHLPKQPKRRTKRTENMDLNTKIVLPMYPV